MGAISDMILEGFECPGCGQELEDHGDGVPLYCFDCEEEID